ncbi:MAG: hypothetical protein V3V17_04215 [Alphaproteobacteria bacterium]
MSLSKRAIETLIDLAENKLTSICSFDREDMREIKALKTCLDELAAMREAFKKGDGQKRTTEKPVPGVPIPATYG